MVHGVRTQKYYQFCSLNGVIFEYVCRLGIQTIYVAELCTYFKLHLTKMWYPGCWRPEYDGIAGSRSHRKPSGRYGDYGCDTPWELVESAVKAMATRQDVDFLLWTGWVPTQKLLCWRCLMFFYWGGISGVNINHLLLCVYWFFMFLRLVNGYKQLYFLPFSSSNLEIICLYYMNFLVMN